jgi:hypothetical protein
MLKRVWRPETGIVIILWLGLLVFGRSRLFHDPGTFWHTKVGQQLLTSRQLIYHDPFSFTAARLFPGENWIPHQWLGECLMAGVHDRLGWDGMLLASATLLAGLYTWLASRLIRAGLHWSLAISLVALAVAAGSSHFHVRPHLSTMVGFGLTCAFLIDFDMGRHGERRGVSPPWRRLAWLIPLYVLWSNVHGGMLGGLFTFGLALAGWVFAKAVGANSPLRSWKEAVPLCLIFLACGLAALVNPYGWRLPATWLTIMRAPHLGDIIQEHARLDLAKPEGVVVVLLGLAYLAVLAGARPRDVRVTWLLPLVWAYFAWDRVRHAPLFGVAAVLAVAEIFPYTRWAEALVRRNSDLFIPRKMTAAGARHPVLGPSLLPLALVLAALALQVRAVPLPVLGRGWAQFDVAIWPVELAGPLRQLPAGTRVFNELNFGGFLIYHAPQTRIFIDDRCELYGDEFLQEYDRVARREPGQVERWQQGFGFTAALTQRGSVLDAYFRAPDSGWQVAAESQAATLFRRDLSPPDEQAVNMENRATTR